MAKNKVFLLLLDGVGLRNFAYSNFIALGEQKNNEVVFWNKTHFPIASLGFKEVKIEHQKIHPVTDTLKKAKKDVNLNVFIQRSGDKVYNAYKFKFSYKTLNAAVKSILARLLIFLFSSEWGLKLLDKYINYFERRTAYYTYCKAVLQTEKPTVVFCTSQRHVQSIAPLLAAKDLGIPTVSFIFSWDNLPKATMVVETDYYLVWSDHMKAELLYYHPNIKADQIKVTGTPQFEIHFDKDSLLSREAFFEAHALDVNKKYICFSGDDVTTSPDDPKYLGDLALAVERLNQKGHNLGIIFRRCPVDFSSRYDAVISRYQDSIVSIDPIWKPFSSHWNMILPTKEDGILFSNIAEHCEMVVNLGSTTLFDFLSHNKPCGYFRYNQSEQNNPKWDIFRCYKFVHFRSMPSAESVIWLDSPADIDLKIENVLLNQHGMNSDSARKWFEKINQHPVDKASERIWETIENITKESLC